MDGWKLEVVIEFVDLFSEAACIKLEMFVQKDGMQWVVELCVQSICSF